MFGGYWEGGGKEAGLHLSLNKKKSDTAGHGDKWRFTPPPPAGRGNAGRFTPCWTGERRLQCGGLPPAGRGNAGRFTPCRTGERRYWNVAVYPLPDGGTPNAMWNAMWRFTPLPDGGTPIWIVAVHAGYGNVTATIANVLPV